jgi:hypothetical protein
MNPQELVFDNVDLKRIIITKMVKLKYNEELKEKMKNLLDEEIKKKWFLYCRCDLCTNAARLFLNDGLLI